MATNIPVGWYKATLGMLARKGNYGLVDGPFGSNLPASDYTSTGIPVIRGSNLALGEARFRDKEFVFVSRETANRLKRSLCGPDDIIFTKKGTLGQTGVVPRDHRYKEFLLSSNQMKLSVDTDIADPLFVYYYVSSPSSKEKILRDAEATGVPKTNLAYLQAFPISLPPLQEQRAIASILGSLDDKIELNRRMNETLEEMARALFKSWFVDFDPVRARMEGRQPAGMNDETAALFPDSFEDSPLGEIPKGWRVDSFSEMIDLLGGGTPKTSIAEYWNGEIPWFSVVDAPRDSDVFVIDTEKHITEAGLTNSSTKILPVGTTIISARGTVGRCALVGLPMAMNQSCYGIRGRAGRGDYFTYFATRRLITELERHAHGSVFSTITRNTFHGIKVAIPPSALTGKFDEAVRPYMKRILANLHEVRTLAAIRDALLPKLLSGEIRVREAEEIVEDTV